MAEDFNLLSRTSPGRAMSGLAHDTRMRKGTESEDFLGDIYPK